MMVAAVFNSFPSMIQYNDCFPIAEHRCKSPLNDAFTVPFRPFVNPSVVNIVTTALLEHVPAQFIVDIFIKGNGLLISIPDKSITCKF